MSGLRNPPGNIESLGLEEALIQALRSLTKTNEMLVDQNEKIIMLLESIAE